MKWPKKRDPETEAACLEYLQRMVKECRSEADYIEQFLPSPDNLEDIEEMVDEIKGDLMRMAAEANIVRHLVYYRRQWEEERNKPQEGSDNLSQPQP